MFDEKMQNFRFIIHRNNKILFETGQRKIRYFLMFKHIFFNLIFLFIYFFFLF